MLPPTVEDLYASSPNDDSEERTLHLPAYKRDYAIGIGLIVIVASLWTLSSFVTQDLYGSGYNKPFLVTYMNTSTHSLYLIAFLLRHWWNSRKRDRYVTESCYDAHHEFNSRKELYEMSDPTIGYNTPLSEDSQPPLTKRETAHLAFVFLWVAFIGSWSANLSLELTSVASSTILSSISGFFTLVIGRLFRVETLGLVKIVAVVTSFAGVVLVSLSDSTSQPPTTNMQHHQYLEGVKSRSTLGDALSLISALFTAICVILLKVRMKEESRVDMQLFFGLVGVFNILLLWPIGLILHLTGAEIFELPLTKHAQYAIIANMAITILSDYLAALAMLKTSPLVVMVGLSLTIPIAVVADFLRKTPVHGTVIVGAMLVTMSFVGIGLEKKIR
ncbi:hypothetical protein BYT27DRAFT_7077301 [Phlegmacium glaucopus]|nr:hypothetical protein BYT27DRAFT_7077301 [Phlegmacium glaucopus]